MAEANTRRVPVVVRIAPTGIAAIDTLAKADGITRSEWIRRAVATVVHRQAKATLDPQATTTGNVRCSACSPHLTSRG